MDTKTILLIEDDRDTREVYVAMLRHAGYRVLEAGDGGEGVRLAREQQPDLVGRLRLQRLLRGAEERIPARLRDPGRVLDRAPLLIRDDLTPGLRRPRDEDDPAQGGVGSGDHGRDQAALAVADQP